jgi:hypothetical protein
MISHTPDILTLASLVELKVLQQRPCLSLYQSTHRSHPDNVQDPIRFAELVKSLAASVQIHADPSTQAVLNRVAVLAQDRHFWAHTLDGLAVLASPDCFRIYLLDSAVPDLAVVADSFHTKPLRHYLQSVDRYQVLALSLNKVQLFEGHRHHLDEVVLSNEVPQTAGELQSATHREPHSTVASYGGVGAGHMAMHHGHGGKKDDMDQEVEQFFRTVDQAVLAHHSKASGLPLMLAALPEHHHLFHAVSRNPWLMPQGLQLNPASLSRSELQQRAWAVAAPQQQAKQAAWCEAYTAAAAKGLGSDNLADVAHAAVAGRVETLLIASGLEVAGRIDASTGRIDHAQLQSSRVDDVLDDLAEVVEKMGGQVHVLASSGMPTPTGVAASFRH